MSPVKAVWRYFTDVKWSLRASAILSALTTMSTVALLATSGWLIARASQMPPVLDLSIAIVGVRTFALLRSVTRYSERVVSHNATFASLPRIRIAIFNKLEELTPSGLTQFHRGDLMSRIVADVEGIQDLTLRVYLPIVSSAISAIFCVALVGWILPIAGVILAVALLVAATAVPYLSVASGRVQQVATAKVRSEFNSSLLDYYEGLADITMLDAGNDVFNQLDLTNEEAASIESSFAARTGFAATLIVLIQGLTLTATIYASFKAMQSGTLASVNTVVLGLIPLAVFESVTSLPNAMLSLMRVRGVSERLIDILETPTTSDDNCMQTVTSCDIALDHVSARWPGSERFALADISLSIPHKSTHVLVGQSGSGKSSAIATMTKLLERESGSLIIGDTSIDELAGVEVRSHIVATGHDSHVFSTSISENLRLAGNSGTTEAELWNALEQVELAGWVRSLPIDINTIIGDQGVTMSGGQRQRLILARLFINDPDVWIIDEPTEHLNSELADLVLSRIRRASMKSSLIIATHRLRDTSATDIVTVLDDGNVIESGKQTDLSSSGSYFSENLANELAAHARTTSHE